MQRLTRIAAGFGAAGAVGVTFLWAWASLLVANWTASLDVAQAQDDCGTSLPYLLINLSAAVGLVAGVAVAWLAAKVAAGSGGPRRLGPAAAAFVGSLAVWMLAGGPKALSCFLGT